MAVEAWDLIRGETAADLLPRLPPEETEFLILCFEGPDSYSRVGGLGARVTELCRALAESGYQTHLVFIGDPMLPEREVSLEGRLCLHRRCGWISRYYPGGVYEGEEAKVADYRAEVPGYALAEIIRPAVAAGRRVVVMAEEWQTAAVACDLSDTLYHAGLRRRTLMLWNANSAIGFDRLDWPRLRTTQAITTVSRWMKHLMWEWGCNAIVIPNGIPARLLHPAPRVERLARALRQQIPARPLLVKVARWDPDKRWHMAVEAVAGLRKRGVPALLIARGGNGDHGADVLRNARAAGLRIAEVEGEAADPAAVVEALVAAAPEADLLNVQFCLSEAALQVFYRAADGVLANSGREPFGLVGLEAMAAGGVVYTGATGEDYARPFDNAVVLETDDPREITAAALELLAHPEQAECLRREARETAARYTWDRVLPLLLRRLRYLAMVEGWEQ
ncbi:MAG: glycosyltransferase family 4 protein [Armatimonadetes bacterium]|nr:glycosyltransferase family 4 protein [Armatimonadota bacterium]